MKFVSYVCLVSVVWVESILTVVLPICWKFASFGREKYSEKCDPKVGLHCSNKLSTKYAKIKIIKTFEKKQAAPIQKKGHLYERCNSMLPLLITNHRRKQIFFFSRSKIYSPAMEKRCYHSLHNQWRTLAVTSAPPLATKAKTKKIFIWSLKVRVWK